VSFTFIMTTSMTRSCFTKQHQICKTFKTKIKTAVYKTKTTACKTKTDFLVSDRSCPKINGLRPHHWLTGCILIITLFINVKIAV